MAAISSKPKVNVQKQNPFLGLRAFQTDEANLFFGRKRLNSELLLKLRQTRFLAIVGNSGTGKSSLVRAGLIPTVQSGFVAQAGSSWRVAIMQPNREPIQELTHALARRSVLHPNRKMEPNYPKQVENCLHRSSRGLMEAYKNAKIPNENLLIFIDQFEEVFQLYNQEKHIQSDRNQATKLINLLVAAVQQSEYPIYVVITLRADFIEAANAFRDLPEIINNGQFLIPRMNRKELSQVIGSPLQQAEINITPRLKTRLLEDALDSQDQLPILQHCLMRTFDHWRKQNTPKPIDINDYEAVGGMKNALSIHANEAYDTLKNEEQKRLAAWLFKATT
ncbi:MAG: ABC transporter ATP-binding protein, partial [Chitinophagales bacterium]